MDRCQGQGVQVCRCAGEDRSWFVQVRLDDESAMIENDWKFAAMVLDRLCLITFTLFTVIATVAVLAAAPHVIVK